MKFSIGQVLATPGILELMAKVDPLQIHRCLLRHVAGDWGDLCTEDKEQNEYMLVNGGRLFSAYKLNNGDKIWIITEADRSATTMLLPEEY